MPNQKLLKIMTFNSRGDWADDGEDNWRYRSAFNIETVLKHSPDIIGLQEMGESNLRDYDNGLAGYDIIQGIDYTDKEPCAYNSIYWKKESFPNARESKTGKFWLSESPEKRSGSWGTECIRSANWRTFKGQSEDSHEFILLNTHLDHVSEEARCGGARVIIRMMKENVDQGVPVIITGDFNCNPGSEAHKAFLSAGYHDSFLDSGHLDGEDVFSFHAFTGTRHGKAGRIDWILFHPAGTALRAESSEIIRDSRDGKYPSDHFPVVSVMKYT